MPTSVNDRPEPTYEMDSNRHIPQQRSSDDDGTFVGEDLSQQQSWTHTQPGIGHGRSRSGTHLTVETAHDIPRMNSVTSPSQTREQASRLNDDLTVLQIERGLDAQEALQRGASLNRSMTRQRSRREELVDDFDAATNPLHEQAARYSPPENPTTNVSKFFKKVHNSSWLVRYFTYITPLVLLILVPILVGALAFPNADVGGVELSWFGIWLMIVWLTLWLGRVIAKCLPWPIGMVSSLFTNNSKKWRDMGKQLELPATLFFWWLAIECSFLPTMKNHNIKGDRTTKPWQNTMNKVIVSFFVGFTLNFIEKIILQLIAISFHLRTYQDRIELNKFQIGSLAKLYKYSKEKIAMDDSEFEGEKGRSGARTPGQVLNEAQNHIKEGMTKFGDIAGKVAGDFTGRKVTNSGHPNQVVLQLIGSPGGAQVLARRLYRTFARPETETVHSDDLKNAFESDEEADAAFSMFDKDMNGDISMEELEAVCVEIGRERKSITASLKDLDSVVSKLDDVFMFIVLIITIIVFISLISTSAAGVLTSAGSTLLALSWLFSATAQEFLQSCIFVFVKHPYDVGDRVQIYGNTGDLGRGDDYFVKEIALFYTEFKKMQGHVVQAPNSYLNTLFILNHRRSGALAEAIPMIIKFGTTLEQIDNLRQCLLEFVTAEKREYQTNILTELRAVQEVHWLELNVVFFYKSSWQNELLRLQRRNKFICALTLSIQECGIEGPRMRYPGQKESFPVYLQNMQNPATPGVGHNGTPDNPNGTVNNRPMDEPFVAPAMDGNAEVPNTGSGPARQPSILRNANSNGRRGGETIAAMGKRVDFSLGMNAMGGIDPSGDVLDDRETEARNRATVLRVTSPSRHSQDRNGDNGSRVSNDSGRSTGIQRVGTNASLQTRERTHRNRFFSRNRHGADEEAGMADIPEVEHDTPSRTNTLDPRTGLVSSQAVRMSTDDSHRTENSHLLHHPTSSGALPATADSDRTFAHPSRAQTDNIEMRRMH
ncbi:mechanosensitive ion channel [Parastagonospora nodorum]|uniref:Mechanosensitive ion channel n=1 Tax=Phaeosphaeria nodorum (strain SN15 / ATCC MYA-4574 / FGSC 10173) TaxID=321614 RepID=A0A7U2I371_PHANO|nr:mechanosensitive ion channel [Parastagonospora nodorum]QRC98176.1 mechanosensitive ion channel [Parastagonospora nodorum SN15]KAH3936034.1 mechanosensitive ion channel [Parastagonospora nodorum]KAH3945693.1 mechanosensitive ion channel [Parastagonospora nodorum]KAH3989492.1 mechanosensitive ion channel [Parastagonospora nodorum]